MTDRYDGLDLRRGSSHHQQVQTLQQDLRELGFWLVGEADGIFGRLTYWALREFQAYAAMSQVAAETVSGEPHYADRLSPVATGNERYTGPISGVLNAATRTSLQHWLDSRWRCPVVIEAWRMRRGQRQELVAENLWLHNDLEKKRPRVFARDISDYYNIPADHSGDDRLVVGDYTTFLSWSGPRSIPPNHVWEQGELLPEHLLGVPLDQLSVIQLATYKVVRAVSEVECIGFFDSVNAYDNAFISVGPCHWTLGIVSNQGNVSEGELCGYLAYLAEIDPAAFQQTMQHFGVRIDKSWRDSNGVANGAALFNRSQRKYTAWLAMQQENGNFDRLIENEAEANYFKSWHWFYRFVMAGRTIPGYRQGMWDMARIRLRDLLMLPWSSSSDTLTLADIFTSEKALAMLLRWHIRFPGHVAVSGRAGRRLQAVLQDAQQQASQLNWDNPANWIDAHEAALIASLRRATAQAGGGLDDTIQYVDEWPSWATGSNPRRFKLDKSIASLSEARNSFQFDSTDLPPAP